MPTYEYECKKCGHRFDAFQSMSDEPLKKCPECSGVVKRLIGAGAGIIFKGSGFYVTDSRSSSGSAKSTSSKESASSDSTSSTDTKSGSGDKKSGTATADKKTTPSSSKKNN